MDKDIWHKLKKIFCVIPGIFNALLYTIHSHTRTAYAKRCFPGVEFRPLAFANHDCKFETPCRIWENTKLANVRMGRHSYCASGCVVHNATIGRFCSIGNGVIIGAWIHPTHLVSTFPGFYAPGKHTINFYLDKNIKEEESVTIGNDVWIGKRALLLGGITVGDGVIIGAGSIVTKDVEPYSIVAGVPARLIRKRFSQSIIDQLLEIRWWEYDDEFLMKSAHLFKDPGSFLKEFSKIDYYESNR